LPYSVKSLNSETANTATNATTAATAANATQLGGVAANQYVVTTDPRMTDSRTPLSGSSDYIQNQNSGTQITSNFSIGGVGSANIFNAGTQFQIAGLPFVSRGRGTAQPETSTFVGVAAGQFTLTQAIQNSLFGFGAGSDMNTGSYNSFFGVRSGSRTISGNYNTFAGLDSGLNNTSGSYNTFIGNESGLGNDTGNFNTTLGYRSDVFSSLSNATAIGNRARATQNNSVVLGSVIGINGAVADTNVGIGTTAPNYKLHVVGENVRVEGNTTSIFPRFSLNFTGGASNAKKWQNYATTNTLVFSALNDAENAETQWLLVNRNGTTISGVAFPTGKVAIGAAFTNDTLGINGTVSIGVLGSAGSTALCQNAMAQISTCSSSIRYKDNIKSFTPGLDLIRRLRPVSFNWKADSKADMGLVAEEVNAVEPLLTTVNEKGEVEGVKYDRVGVVLVNAINEQQKMIEEQQRQIAALTAIICGLSPTAKICQK
jgi:hypothetical protein